VSVAIEVPLGECSSSPFPVRLPIVVAIVGKPNH
jgi:hypothetical protein